MPRGPAGPHRGPVQLPHQLDGGRGGRGAPALREIRQQVHHELPRRDSRTAQIARDRAGVPEPACCVPAHRDLQPVEELPQLHGERPALLGQVLPQRMQLTHCVPLCGDSRRSDDPRAACPSCETGWGIVEVLRGPMAGAATPRCALRPADGARPSQVRKRELFSRFTVLARPAIARPHEHRPHRRRPTGHAGYSAASAIHPGTDDSCSPRGGCAAHGRDGAADPYRHNTGGTRTKALPTCVFAGQESSHRVEPRRVELLTSAMQRRRSTN